MTDVDVPQPREAVDVALAGAVPDVDALTFCQNQWPRLGVAVQVSDRVQNVRQIQLEPILKRWTARGSEICTAQPQCAPNLRLRQLI